MLSSENRGDPLFCRGCLFSSLAGTAQGLGRRGAPPSLGCAPGCAPPTRAASAASQAAHPRSSACAECSPGLSFRRGGGTGAGGGVGEWGPALEGPAAWWHRTRQRLPGPPGRSREELSGHEVPGKERPPPVSRRPPRSCPCASGRHSCQIQRLPDPPNVALPLPPVIAIIRLIIAFNTREHLFTCFVLSSLSFAQACVRSTLSLSPSSQSSSSAKETKPASPPLAQKHLMGLSVAKASIGTVGGGLDQALKVRFPAPKNKH